MNEMRILRWTVDVLSDKEGFIRSERNEGSASIHENNSLKWYGHVMGRDSWKRNFY